MRTIWPLLAVFGVVAGQNDTAGLRQVPPPGEPDSISEYPANPVYQEYPVSSSSTCKAQTVTKTYTAPGGGYGATTTVTKTKWYTTTLWDTTTFYNTTTTTKVRIMN